MMTKNQNIVMWCGVIILCVYLFTDKNFKNVIFGKSGTSGTGPAPNTPLLTAYMRPASGTWSYAGAQAAAKPVTKTVTL